MGNFHIHPMQVPFLPSKKYFIEKSLFFLPKNYFFLSRFCRLEYIWYSTGIYGLAFKIGKWFFAENSTTVGRILMIFRQTSMKFQFLWGISYFCGETLATCRAQSAMLGEHLSQKKPTSSHL